jgi:hypothetical protein
MPLPSESTGMRIEINVNPSDILSIKSRLDNTRGRITPELWVRAKTMAALVVARLDNLSPVGAGGVWRRGSPPIRGAHRARVPTPHYAEVYTVAPHEVYIVQGFEPHMPPASAWLGDQNLSYIMRRAVLEHGTPENPRPYWDQVEREAIVTNEQSAAMMEKKLTP